MTTARTCPGCAVVVPVVSGRCPACGMWMGLGPGAARPAVAVAASLVAIGTWWLGHDRDPGPTVGVTPGITRLSPDGRGTDVAATIDNPNPMPVDVTVRVRGFGIADRIVAEKTLGPYRGLPPGASRDIRHHFATTPLANVTFEAVEVVPTDADGP